MAELTVIGWVVSPLIKRLSEKVLSYAGDQYKWLKAPADSLERLASSLTRIQAASGSVERQQQQTQIKDVSHEAWLLQLKDAIYEIDDVLDEFSYLALKAGSQSKVSRSLSNYGRTVKRMFGKDKPITKLKSLLERLDAMEKSYEGLVGVATLEAIVSSQVVDSAAASSSGPDLTGSIATEDERSVRKAERQALISRLIGTSGQINGKPIRVVAVIGASGMGKTTLAQFAFNSPEVEKCFEMMMWVSVRVLDISNSDVTILPENVGRMIHLRYFALCRTVNVLPQSIADLLHLQTAKFENFFAYGSQYLLWYLKRQKPSVDLIISLLMKF